MESFRDVRFVLHSVLAAEFEDCMERFHVLCNGMQTNADIWPETKEKFHQSRKQLLRWGRTSGAANRSLDHALRKNTNLQSQVHVLLEDLNAALQASLSLFQQAATPLLSPGIIESTQSSYFEFRPSGLRYGREPEPVKAEDIDNSHSDISDTLNRLERLSLSLADPFSADALYGEDSANASLADVNLASRMFPKSSTALKQRLGKANWTRRLFLRNMKARLRQEKFARSEGLMTPGGILSPAVGPLRSTHAKKPLPDNQPIQGHRALLGSITSRRTSVSGSLTADSGFWSRSDSYTADTSTSMGEAEDAAQAVTLSVPPPPVALSKNAVFQCHYCGQDIIVGETSADQENRYHQHVLAVADGDPDEDQQLSTPAHSFALLEVLTSEDWCRHVLADLEPYCCTVDDCKDGARTYHSVALWLQHELDVHRLVRLWSCQLCEDQSRDPKIFRTHLSDRHSIDAEGADVFLDLCERYAEDDPDLACSLCALSCSSLDSYRTHVGSHLEQLALASIEDDEKQETTEPTSPTSRDSNADYGRLEEFVSSQSKYYPRDAMKDRNQGRDLYQLPVGTTTAARFKFEPNASPANRPSMPQRGPSYTFMSNARMQQARNSNVVDNPMAPTDRHDEPRVGNLKRTNPPPRNIDFVGRIDELNALHQCLSGPGSLCVLRGVSGLGKSTLAAEFTYRFEPEYGYIFWVQAENAMVCIDTYSQIATKATGGDFADLDEQRLVTLSRDFLESTPKKWLLVFDNVDQQLDLRRFLPSKMSQTTGSVLITTNRGDIGIESLLSRDSDSNPSISWIDLEPLTLEESRCLLLSATMKPGEGDFKNHPEYALAGDIAKRAQRLPLALSLIAGYVMVEQCPLSEFVNLWNERRKNISATPQGRALKDSDQAMEAAWDLSLREISNDSQKFLHILAFLDPDRIQKDLLVGPHEDPGLDYLRPSESYRYTRMIAQLRRRRLIVMESKHDEEVISIHRKLQAKILRDLDKEGALNRVFEQVFYLVRARFPAASPIQVPEPEKWPACKKYLPHVLSLQKLALSPAMDITINVQLAGLFSDGGIDLWERGMTVEGLELLRCAEATLDQLTANESLLRADIHVIISLLLQDSGLVHIAECKDRIETALEARKQYQASCNDAVYTKNDEILLYNAWSDYACVLLQFNLYNEAEPIFFRCSEQYKQWGEPAKIPYEYAKFHHHIAFCHLYNNRLEEAIHHAREGLKWVQQATGDSAATYRWMFDLGCIEIQVEALLTKSTSTTAVKPLATHTDVLKARIRLHGKFAFLTLESYYAVAACHSYMGNIAEAESTLRTILELEKTRPGSCNAAALARTQFHLAQILRLTEEGSQASQGEPSDTTDRRQSAVGGTLVNESVAVESTGADDGNDGTLPGDDRLSEAYDLEVMASKVLEENKTLGHISQLGIEKDEAKRFLEDNGPMALFDLMQPVFDGRFAGRDVLRFLWIVKGREGESRAKST